MKDNRIKRIIVASLALNLVCAIVIGMLVYNNRSMIIGSIWKSGGGYDYSKNPQYNARTSLFSEYTLKTADICFAGDSITARCDYSELFTTMDVANRGIGSDTTEGLLNRIDQITALNPKYCVILIGINDISNCLDIDEAANNMYLIIESLTNYDPNMQIYILSILPCNIQTVDIEDVKTLNGYYKNICNVMPNAEYVDLFDRFSAQYELLISDDGVHLSGSGYRCLYEELRKRIMNE